MKQLKLHVLYEHGLDTRPFSSSYIRLLRPLTHPRLSNQYQVSWDTKYQDQNVDGVIIDRLWHEQVSLPKVKNLFERVQKARSRLIYAIDDDLPDVLSRNKRGLKFSVLPVVEFLLHNAHGIVVTTPQLKETFSNYNNNIVIIPNMLDERLLIKRTLPGPKTPFGKRPITIGYMGTLTHDDDMKMILPALQTFFQRYKDQAQLEIIGGIEHKETREAFSDLPVRIIKPTAAQSEYPHFMLWYAKQARWDIALAPLKNTSFNNCKSDIKFLDYSAIGAPAIYSCVPAYQNSIQHLETGWLAENNPEAWLTALESLYTDLDLRQRLSANASRHLYTKRILAHNVQKNWDNALQTLLSAQ